MQHVKNTETVQRRTHCALLSHKNVCSELLTKTVPTNQHTHLPHETPTVGFISANIVIAIVIIIHQQTQSFSTVVQRQKI